MTKGKYVNPERVTTHELDPEKDLIAGFVDSLQCERCAGTGRAINDEGMAFETCTLCGGIGQVLADTDDEPDDRTYY